MNEKYKWEYYHLNPSQLPILPPPLPPECGWIYTVKAGDFLSSIARQFGIPVRSIIEANPELTPPYLIQPGQNLILPIKVHTVTPGQTLYSIGELYGFDWRDIARVNQINPPYTIRPGQKLAIPGVTCDILPPPVPPPPPACPGFMYEIKQGDTLYNLARQYGTTVDMLLKYNPGIDPRRLQIGQKICIPVPETPTCPGFMYEIKQGDTLYSLARRYGTTVDMLLKYNPGIDPRRLQIGQKICIPVPETGSEKRCLILANTNVVPKALALALLDYTENKIMVILDQVPDPVQLGTELNVYKAWLQSPQGYTVFSLYPTPQKIWAARSTPAQLLKNYNRIQISAEKETNTAQPAGPLIATGILPTPS
ncbi:MAG: LysM peptidoglycan-binding domain-containing protein [Syntrophomonadaceae bacterium]|nr:LysM peptidoglycan-binding domain-containing protein [Syntrophomonadaceae bacterium]